MDLSNELISVGNTALKELIKNVVTDLYNIAKKAATEQTKFWVIDKSTSELIEQVAVIRRVKTLWQVDKPVDITEFYCAPHVDIEKKRVRVNTISDISIPGSVLITGIAGHGKSIFLRHLVSQCLLEGKSIPLFVELRRVQPSETIIEHMLETLESLELGMDMTMFKRLGKAGKFILFLDGFDEIAESGKPRLVSELERLACMPGIKVFVTSRPNAGLEVSPHYSVIKIANLKSRDFKEIIFKLADDETAHELIRKVVSHKGEIAELLCTPLMVTLLVVSYKSYQELPINLSGFYDNLFQVLLQRHDGVKPGFKRQRRCVLNDYQFRNAFNAMSFESKKSLKYDFTEEDFVRFATKAFDASSLKEDPLEFVRDITDITCLLLKEGNECKFIHKTVQEYYAAAYLQSIPEQIAKSFYTKCMDEQFFRGWHQVLQFAEEIDSYRYYMHFLIPLCLRYLDRTKSQLQESSKPPKASKKYIKSLFGSISISMYIGGRNQFDLHLEGMPPLVEFGFSKKVIKVVLSTFPEKINKTTVRSVASMVDNDIGIDQLMTITEHALVDLYEKASAALEYVDSTVKNSLVLDDFEKDVSKFLS